MKDLNVTIKCELSKPYVKASEKELHDLADALNEFFHGNIEYFEITSDDN